MDNDSFTEFSHDDALILFGIRRSKRGETVTGILAWEDFANRSESTCAELDLALRRFLALGLITRYGNRFMPTALLNEWPVDASDQWPFTETVKRFQAELNARSAELLTAELPEQILNEATYRQAMRRYLIGFFTTLSIPLVVLILLVIAAARYSWYLLLIPLAIIGGIVLWLWIAGRREE